MEMVYCEICGECVPESEAHYYEDGGYWACNKCWESEFVECERCGERIPYDDAYKGIYGYLCEYCHDDLFG